MTIEREIQPLSPAYNQCYFEFDDADKSNDGFRYIVEVGTIAAYKLRPIPVSLYGQVDLSKLLQTQLYNDYRLSKSYIADGHLFEFELQVDKEYFVIENFTDYAFGGANWVNFTDPQINAGGATRTMLIFTTQPNFNIGDTINIQQNQSANFRQQLEGIHTIIDIWTDNSNWFIVLDLLWIGSGATSSGNVRIANGLKTKFTGITTDKYKVFKGAIPWADFPNYQNNNLKSNFITTLPEEARISNRTQTKFQYLKETSGVDYVVFTIDGEQYRYATLTTVGMMMVDVLPTDDIIEEQLIGGVWTAYTSGIILSEVKTYTVEIDGIINAKSITLYNECDYFDLVDVTFLDRLGSWVTVAFNKALYLNQTTERNELRKKSPIEYTALDRGLDSYHTEQDTVITLNSGQLNPTEANYYKELFSTAALFVTINNEETRSANVVDTNFELMQRRTAKERNAELKVRYSVNDNING